MKKALKWIGIALVALIAIGIIFGENKGKAPATASHDASGAQQTAQQEVPAAVPAKEPAIKVSAKKLFQAYDDNEAAADDEYKGKLLEVEGRIASIDKDAFNNTIVWLRAKDDFNRVMAKLSDEEAPKAKALKKGQTVTVSCQGSTRIIGNPTLERCAIL
ncbi:OB-fold putative lipoprotein [Chromobacterium rhizoryzae]|uniref:OB-fold putative lipoprotein n=1 Tax=Chromobacterium rhizoryzae TaxID=1778675 RepID=UPI001D06CA6E|nr:OB-fold putative lipoprotein [Chromobacterium rhizoryzae]